MTAEQIRAEINEIKYLGDDPETQHIREDMMLEKVLRAISEGAAEPASLAKAALEVKKLGFVRLYSGANKIQTH